MNAAQIISAIVGAIQTFREIEPVLAEGWNSVRPFAIALYQRLSGHDITEDELTALEASLDALHVDFQTPLPPE